MSGSSNPLLKYAVMPLSILAILAAGSIFVEFNHIEVYKHKYNLDDQTVDWLGFAVNVSILVGILPALLYSKLGPKITLLSGAVLLTAAHLVGIYLLSSVSSILPTVSATFLLFGIAILGG